MPKHVVVRSLFKKTSLDVSNLANYILFLGGIIQAIQVDQFQLHLDSMYYFYLYQPGYRIDTEHTVVVHLSRIRRNFILSD